MKLCWLVLVLSKPVDSFIIDFYTWGKAYESLNVVKVRLGKINVFQVKV